MSQLYFLSGLPRSGSTVLAAILNQHPQVRVTPTSGLIDIMGAVIFTWENHPAMTAQGKGKDGIIRLLRAIVENECGDGLVIDKARGWPNPSIMTTMAEVLGQPPKIVATVRSIPDCAASFVRLVQPDDAKTFLRTSPLIAHLQSSYVTLHQGFETAPENFCILDYDDLMDDPQEQLDRVHAFLGLNPWLYDFENLDPDSVAEQDEAAWGIPGLHNIKPKLERQHTEDTVALLGDLHGTFMQPAFWKGETAEDREPQLIDLQKEANMRGQFKKGREIGEVLAAKSPGDDRAAFNRAWNVLADGKLQEGMTLLNRGRADDVFGNPNPGSGMPIWNGEPDCTVLLNLEAGFGDQIHSVRFAKDIAARGCKVITGGSPEIISVIKDCEGVASSCAVDAGPMTYHDYWIPGMAAVIPLGLEYADIDGAPYIDRQQYRTKTNKRLRIGMRWRGNVKIEADAQRTFPAQLMFDAVRDIDADFVCLQRDEGIEERPSWMALTPLDDWLQTAEAIAGCDLVISSCTSVAHLAAAMGVQTWVVIPILPYWIWAAPGSKSPWYDCVTLFRQEEYGDWEAPFLAIQHSLVEYRHAA